MPISVAIVGSGPAGCYTADALVKSDSDVNVDIIERLPAPFGLIRYGVAPDHQTTKNVSRSFERTVLNEHVRYWGNVEVGRDVSMDELRSLYDAVVLAVGAPYDQTLGITGEDKAGVIGSASFVGWYNGHPDFRDLDPNLDTDTVAVIGVGNVAIDVARVLVKTRAEMAKSDAPEYVLAAIEASPIRTVHMCGRRGPVEAKFTNVELREMGELEASAPVVDPGHLPESVAEEGWSDRDRRLKEKNLATLTDFSTMDAGGRAKRVHFQFYASPVEILGGERVEGLRLERTEVIEGRAVGTGEFFEIDCGLVITATGYRSRPLDGVPFDEKRGICVNSEGRIADGLYAVGWVKRGPSGVISTNRPDGKDAAQHILDDFDDGQKPGRAGLETLLRERGARWVSYEEWQKIEAEEISNAPPEAPRAKFTRVEDMLAALD